MTLELLAPVAAASEVEALEGAGADALYCGLYDEAWAKRWGLAWWPNRRGPGRGNLRTAEQLGELCRAASAPVYLTLNAPLHNDAQIAALREGAQAWSALGVAAFVVGDVALLRLLARDGHRVFASTIAGALNGESARLLVDLGAERVILGRHLRLDEILAIREQAPEVPVEVFGMHDHCRYEEAFCSAAHHLPGWGVWCVGPRRREGPAWDAAWAQEDALLHRDAGAVSAQHPTGSCGLCAIPALRDAGVAGFKIVGREAPLVRRFRATQAARVVRDAEAGAVELAQEIRGDARGCAARAGCLYPEALPPPARTR